MAESTRDPVVYRVFNEIGIIDQLATAAFRQVLPPPLNTMMFGVLNHFVRLGDDKTPSALASAFQISRPSMTATLDKLERAGFVQIVPDSADKRTKRVRITAAGRKARARAVEATAVLFERIQPRLASMDQDNLLDQLQQLRCVLDDAR